MTDNIKSRRYMVYISFDRCDDLVRYSFVSHLSASLRRQGMIISPSFKESMENIKIEAFVVVVSEKYLLDAECLNELADIVDCQQNNKTVVVVPVLYGISQLEVVKRSDILRDLFPEGNYSADLISRWTSALKKLTDDSKTRNQYVDCGLVEDISREVYQKVFPTERIGIYSRLLEIKNLLCKQSWGIRNVGIWGMPGIGKTTLAKAAFDQMSGDYEASCFIEDFDIAFRENGLYGLLKEHFGKTLKEEYDIISVMSKPTQKRVLIVLDNVCKPLDAESFLNGFKYFGPGSLIIITSRNKQVFVQCCINQIYEVKGLNESEAKQLFSRCASRKGWRTESDQETLTPLGLNHLMSVIEFASGNPLALSLYAKLLSHKTPKEMETECLNLKNTPPSQIMKAFKSSYDTLSDNEKTMFLDIACFFSGEDVDYVMQLFGGCGFFPLVGIYVLVEKCLVTILENKVQMHNLIEIIGRQVANEEIIQHERHCRLWDASIIQPLLEDEEIISPMDSEGVEDIEAIFLETSNLNFFVKSIAFKSMHNLRFLKIYSSNPEKHQGLRFHKTLESLPNELRLLHWEDYPLQSLPQDFDPNHLVELNMPYSQLHKLWGGTKTLEMLKTVRLCHSQQLVEIDDLLKAQNIEVIDLRGCIRFQRFIATGHLQHLRVINLTGCVQINSIPEVPPNIEELYLSGTGIKEISTSNVTLSTHDKLHCRNCRELVNLRAEISRVAKALNLKRGDNDVCLSLVNSTEQDSLKVLDLSGCSDLKNIQAFPRNLKELYLSETAIREVSSSISFLTGLNVLDMTNCKGLQHLPMGMSNLTSLVKLVLSGCSELESIQDFPRNLKELYLAGTAIKEVPSSLCDLSELVKLDVGNCKRLENLPIGMCNLISLVTLTLSGCSELEDIHDLPRNLQILNLAETPIRKMPSSFEDLTELIALDLNHCKKLQHLRMGFFRSAIRIELSGCSELEYILGFSLQSMVLLHIDGTNKVMLHGPPPCKVSLIWENWRRFQLLPREMTGSKFILTLMPSVTTPYGSKLPFSMSSSLVSSMYAVVSLLLSNTFLSDIHIPQEICHFPSLKTLDLEGSGFRKLPESLKQIRNLKSLILCHCPNLESLPELPQSLELLNAHSCSSLKNIHWSFEQFPRDYTFFNCFNLSPELVTDFLEKGLASVANMAREDLQKLIKAPVFSFSVPASVSLKTIFHLQRGSFVNIRLTTRTETLLGFRLSVVVSFLEHSYKDTGFGIRCVCRWENMKGLQRRLERIFDCSSLGEVAPKVRKDHMFVFCDVSMRPGGAEGSELDIRDDLVFFEFLPVNRHNRLLDDCCMITKCGVDVIAAATKATTLDLQPTTFVRNESEFVNDIVQNSLEQMAAVNEIVKDVQNSLEQMAAVNEIVKDVQNSLEQMAALTNDQTTVSNPETTVSSPKPKEGSNGAPNSIKSGEQLLKQLEEKLDLEYCDENKTRYVGIVGMVGIGKTYLANILYEKLMTKFGCHVLMKLFREKSKDQELDLQKRLVEGLLKKPINFNTENPLEERKNDLIQQKVLVVLDNVSDKKEIEPLLGNCNWIKEGSIIVITTRDKSLLKGLNCELYEVPKLNDRDSLKLFRDRAQVCSTLEENFMELSRKFVDYAGGNPLALKKLGKELYGKEKDHWEARLGTLTQCSNPKIREKLRICYDELNEQEKDVFLDIAYFFRSEDQNYVTSLLDSFDPESAEDGKELIRGLADKFLISVCDGRVVMHNLLLTMAKEHVGAPAGKYWLWRSNCEEFTSALENIEGRDKVRGIVVDMSKMEEMPLDNQAFVGMSSLRYLKVCDPGHIEAQCKLNLPDGLEFPKDNNVRYLNWMKFPGKELPSDFEPLNLIDLRLPYSKITSVWNCAKVAPKLKWVDLSHSSKLSSLSGLSEAPNLLRLNLEGCTSLKELPEEMQKMKKLVFLNLRGCTSLLSLPKITMDSLKTLILSGCSKFQTFEVISKNLETLYLNSTAIAELPSAIGKLHGLIFLNLKDCENLATLPDCLGTMKSLQELKLSRCSKLKTLPDVKEKMESLRVLLLNGTSIAGIPGNFSDFSLLRHLCLSRNENIRSLQFEMGQMFHLKWLELKYCKNLTSLPTLPPNLQCLNAHGCTSLRTVASPLALPMQSEQIHSTFNFTNCHELEQDSKNAIISYIQEKSKLMSADRYSLDFVFKSLIGTCFPGCEIPTWFNYQAVGSVLKLELPQDWNAGRSIGIALCVLVSFNKDQNNSLQVKCTCEFTNDLSLSPESFMVGGWSEPGDETHTVESDHIFIGYTTLSNIKKRQQISSATEASLKFEVTNGTSEVAECKVMRCGFSLVYESDEDENATWEANAMENSTHSQRSSYIEDNADCPPSATPTTADIKRGFYKLFGLK